MDACRNELYPNTLSFDGPSKEGEKNADPGRDIETVNGKGKDSAGFFSDSNNNEEYDEKFDASQYAFFGGGVDHEVELGGLGDDDGGLEPTDDLYDESSELDEKVYGAHGFHDQSVEGLTNEFAKLGGSQLWGSHSADESAKADRDNNGWISQQQSDAKSEVPNQSDSVQRLWPHQQQQQHDGHNDDHNADSVVNIQGSRDWAISGQQNADQMPPWDQMEPFPDASSLNTFNPSQYNTSQQTSAHVEYESRGVSVGPASSRLGSSQQRLQSTPFASSMAAFPFPSPSLPPYSSAEQWSTGPINPHLQPSAPPPPLPAHMVAAAGGQRQMMPHPPQQGGVTQVAAAGYPLNAVESGGNSSHLRGLQAQFPNSHYPTQQQQQQLHGYPGFEASLTPPPLDEYQQQLQHKHYGQQQQQQQFLQNQYQQQQQQLQVHQYANARGSSNRGMERGTLQQQQQQLPAGMRSKYMTSDELDAIVRMQWAATHGSEPYLDDYYHQALQAKQAAATGTPYGRRFFAPSQLKSNNGNSNSGNNYSRGGGGGGGGQHAFLQVEGLGRVPLSSIRRPRPLLDMDAYSAAMEGGGGGGLPVPQRPLEQEPMLAARIAIEDGMCLLLDVDDIDRLLLVAHTQSHPPEAVHHLRRRRHMLLEGLAASLQLSDPQAPGSGLAHLHDPAAGGGGGEGGGGGGRGRGDDLVFLRLVSLPKGRKLLARYLRLLPPGSDLQRVVVLATFRHLRFLFGGLQIDPGANGGLANAVATAVSGMMLPGLTACLAAVAVAPEQPPLRSPGSAGDDGATLVLRTLLDRATAARTSGGATPPQQGAWQAAFDVFFDRLSKTLCFDSILNALPLPAATAAAVSKEMPLELLRAALPHTSQAQREQVGALLQGLLRASHMPAYQPLCLPACPPA